MHKIGLVWCSTPSLVCKNKSITL